MTPPLSLRLREWGPFTSIRYLKDGKLKPRQALAALEADADYYHTPCRALPMIDIGDGLPPITYAAKVWRGMSSVHGVANKPLAEQAHVIEVFVQDVHAVGWSQYTLDRAVVAWRRKGERFIPTQGQLALALGEANGISAQKVYRDMHAQMSAAAGEAPNPNKKTHEPPKMSRDELVMAIARKKADKARGYSIARETGKKRPWIRHLDEPVLASLERKLEALST